MTPQRSATVPEDSGPEAEGESRPKAYRLTAGTLTRLPGLCFTRPDPRRDQPHEAAGARQGLARSCRSTNRYAW